MPCCTRKRIVPSNSTVATSLVEIRPSRYIRIQHHNPRPRDEDFSREMSLFMQYKKTGVPSNGPLNMPKKFSKSSMKQKEIIPQSQQYHPLAVNQINSNENSLKQADRGNELIKTMEKKDESDTMPSFSTENTIFSMPTSKSSSVLSSPAHVKDNDKVHSASSVQVAMHNLQRRTDSKQKTNCVDGNVIPETHEPDLHGEHKDELLLKLSENQPQISENNGSNFSNDKSVNDTTLRDTKKLVECNGETSGTRDPVFNLRPQVYDIAIFLIHGVGGSSDIWCAQIDHFAKQGYEVIAPDLIGHGFSCCPKSPSAYHFKEIAADMEETFDRYCKKRNVIIGHSYGASFATLLARSRSRRVHKLVLISGGPPTPLAPQPGVFNLPGCMLGCIKPCLVCGFKKGAFHKKRKAVISKTDAFNIPTYVLQHTMNGQIWADGDEIYHNWLTCPTLLIYGADDKLVSLDEELHMEEAIYNSHLVVIEDASHMVMIEAPGEVNDLLSNFIQYSLEATSKSSEPTSPNHNLPQSHSSHQMPEMGLKRSISHLSQKSIRSIKTHRSIPSHKSKSLKK